MTFRRVWQFGATAILLAVAQGAVPISAAQPAPAQPAQPEVSGRPLLIAAGDALGSKAARARAAQVRAELTGTSFAVEQARLPADPVAEARRVYRWAYDAPAGRLLRDAEQHFPGGIFFWTRSGLGPAGGWQVDVMKWRSGTDLQTFTATEALRPLLQSERLFPHLLIRQAELASSAVATGPNGFRYQDTAGTTVEVTLDPVARLPASAKEIVPQGPATEWLYSDYRPRHGVMLPQRVQTKQGDRVTEDLRLGVTRIAPISAAELAVPAGYSRPPQAGEPRLAELAAGVLFFENMPFNNHSMAVDMGDHLVLIEAPSSPAAAETQRRLLEQARPGKPVRHVLVTHHHGDHNAGLGVWAEQGATIVLPRRARVAVERQLRARGLQGDLRIEEVDDRRSFGSGANRIDAYAFASSHAAAHMVMHLPERRILFQGDLFYLPERGSPPPAFPIVRELQRLIARLDLKVDLIAGVHGRPATMAQMRESLRRPLRRRR